LKKRRRRWGRAARVHGHGGRHKGQRAVGGGRGDGRTGRRSWPGGGGGARVRPPPRGARAAAVRPDK